MRKKISFFLMMGIDMNIFGFHYNFTKLHMDKIWHKICRNKRIARPSVHVGSESMVFGGFEMNFSVSCSSVERRNNERFIAAIPISIGLINLKEGEAIETQFKGMTTDISMKGLGLELNNQGSSLLPLAVKMVGGNEEFDLEIFANLETDDVRGIGEVRWISVELPYFFRIGVFLKEMKDAEKEKWNNFVISQNRGIQRWAEIQVG